MKESILEKLGLSPNEAKVYMTLIKNGEQGVSEISKHSGIHRRNVYDAVRRLLSKGLVFEIISSRESLYGGVDPEKLRELLAEKQNQLELAMPELVSIYQQQTSDYGTFVFEGYQGMKNIWRLILNSKSKVYTLGGKGQWFDPNIKDELDDFFKGVKKQKITFQILFDHQALTRFPDLKNYYKGNGKYRILPADYDTSCTIHVFGEYVVIYNGVGYGKLDPNCSFFIIKSLGIADSYRSWFDFMWTRSKEYKK
jgi:predicted DNA-binding transcriptional regulator